MNIIERKKNLLATNHLMIPMGRDFDYGNALPWFLNMDKLKDYLNSNYDVNVVYSSPSCYAKQSFQINSWCRIGEKTGASIFDQYKNFYEGNKWWKKWSRISDKRRRFLADSTGSWSIRYRTLYFSTGTERLYLGL